MTTIRTEFVGVDRAQSNLIQVEGRLTRLKPLFEEFGSEFYAQEKSLFDLAPWKPLSPAYAERKRREVGDKPILRYSDRLFLSLTQQGSEGNVHRVGDGNAEFGSTVSYGIFHRDTRDPMAEPDIDRYETIAGQFLDEVVRDAWVN
jgi:hypothetical protein